MEKISIRKGVRLFCGTCISALGIAVLVQGKYGVDVVSTFLTGLLHFLPIEFWQSSILFNVVVMLVVFFIDKSQLGIGSIVNGFGIGLCIAVVTPSIIHLKNIIDVYSYLAVFIGPLLVGIGSAIYVKANLGAAALEALMLVLAKKFHLSVRACRIALDAVTVLIGFLLGGSVGIGTIFCVIFIGPTMQKVFEIIDRIDNELVKKQQTQQVEMD